MTRPPETHVEAPAAAARLGARLLPASRSRHPGDVIRLIVAAIVLAGALAVTITTHATYAGAASVTAAAPSTAVGRVLAGLVHVLFAGAAAVALTVLLRHR